MAGGAWREGLRAVLETLLLQALHAVGCLVGAAYLLRTVRTQEAALDGHRDELMRIGWSQADLARQHENFRLLEGYAQAAAAAGVASIVLVVLACVRGRSARAWQVAGALLLGLHWIVWMGQDLVDVLSAGGLVLQGTLLVLLWRTGRS